MGEKNYPKPTKTKNFSSLTGGRTEDLKLNKKLEQSDYNSENYPEVSVTINLPIKTKNTENLKQDPGLKQPNKTKADAPLNDLKKPTDQEGARAPIYQTETRDVKTETQNLEAESQGVETQIDPLPRQPIVMGRQKSLLLPPRLKKVKREKIKNPFFSPEVDKPLSESKTAPLPEEAIDSEIIYRPKANEESIIIEEPSAEPRTAAQSHGQYIGVPTGPHAQVREQSKTDLGVGVELGFFLLIGALFYNTLIAIQSIVNSSVDFTPEAETDYKKKKKETPSIFIFTYLSIEKARLGKWLVVTRNLVNIDERVTKYMIGQVVAIVNDDRNGVIIEIFIEEFGFLNPLEQYISPFKELSILSTLKMEVKLFFESLQSNRFFSLLKVINAF